MANFNDVTTISMENEDCVNCLNTLALSSRNKYKKSVDMFHAIVQLEELNVDNGRAFGRFLDVLNFRKPKDGLDIKQYDINYNKQLTGVNHQQLKDMSLDQQLRNEQRAN